MPISPVAGASRSLVENRRGSNRHRLTIHATLHLDGDHSSPISVVVTHISVGGLGILAKQALVLESIYQVSSFDTLLSPGLRMRVVSQRPRADGQFEIGAKTCEISQK